MNYKKKYLKYKKKYLKIKNIYGGCILKYGEISTEKDLETNLEIVKNYEMERKKNEETKYLSGINYLEYILKYTNLPNACDFIEHIKDPLNNQFKNFFSSILQGFYTVHAHGAISKKQFNDKEILPENVSLITIINSNEKCNLKIYKRSEELGYNILNFNNQGHEYDVDGTDEKLTLNIYTPGSYYHNMYLSNVLTETHRSTSYKKKEYASRVVPGVFSMYNFLQLNKPLDEQRTLAEPQELFEMDTVPVPLEDKSRANYFKEKTYRKEKYETGVKRLNNEFKNMSSILSNDIKHKKIKLSDIICELSQDEGGILIVNSCRVITGFNSEKESDALYISQENIETLKTQVNSSKNSIIKTFTDNKEFWHLLWIISLFNGEERSLNQPELVDVDDWDKHFAEKDTKNIDDANTKNACNIQ